jgi:hypothetical protein
MMCPYFYSHFTDEVSKFPWVTQSRLHSVSGAPTTIFIQQTFSEHLLCARHYLGTGDSRGHRTDENACFLGIYILSSAIRS